MQVTKVEELLVWQRARDFVIAVSAILDSEAMQRDWPLSNQLNASSLSIQDNIAEGFGQGSDRAFARYLYTSRGSALEAAGQLLTACTRGHVTRSDYDRTRALADEIVRMLTGLIRYLQCSDRKVRG